MALLFVVIGAVALLWAGAVLSALVSGDPVPRQPTIATVTAFAHRGDPSAAWGQPVGSAPVYWTCTIVAVLVVIAVGVAGWLLIRRGRRERDADPADARRDRDPPRRAHGGGGESAAA
jgi:hypothetical protein